MEKAPTPWAVASNLMNGMNCQQDFPTLQHSWTLWLALLTPGQMAVTSKNPKEPLDLDSTVKKGIVALFKKEVEDNLGTDWDNR